ncbi:MAG: rhodanese-related sulfurtransferase, partial [Gammaproteobacteria bacterium]
MRAMPGIVISTFYRFTPLGELARLRRCALSAMHECDVRGSVLLAAEGINGCIAGRRAGVDAMLAWLGAQPHLAHLETRETFADAIPFRRAKVKVKQEIVSMGVAGVDARDAGELVRPEEWNALLDDGETLLLDARNQYETAIGGFAGALTPHTENFREFPAFAARRLDARRAVAMYCTGGIRCEKASAYLKMRGFARVVQLQGGILNYLARIGEGESRWRGECFVFDERVSVDRHLRRGAHEQCHACRRPLSQAARHSAHYLRGISCPHCH